MLGCQVRCWGGCDGGRGGGAFHLLFVLTLTHGLRLSYNGWVKRGICLSQLEGDRCVSWARMDAREGLMLGRMLGCWPTWVSGACSTGR